MILFCVIAKLTRNDELTGKSAIQGNNRVFLHKVKFLIPTLWVKFFFFYEDLLPRADCTVKILTCKKYYKCMGSRIRHWIGKNSTRYQGQVSEFKCNAAKCVCAVFFTWAVLHACLLIHSRQSALRGDWLQVPPKFSMTPIYEPLLIWGR